MLSSFFERCPVRSAEAVAPHRLAVSPKAPPRRGWRPSGGRASFYDRPPSPEPPPPSLMEVHVRYQDMYLIEVHCRTKQTAKQPYVQKRREINVVGLPMFQIEVHSPAGEISVHKRTACIRGGYVCGPRRGCKCIKIVEEKLGSILLVPWPHPPPLLHTQTGP